MQCTGEQHTRTARCLQNLQIVRVANTACRVVSSQRRCLAQKLESQQVGSLVFTDALQGHDDNARWPQRRRGEHFGRAEERLPHEVQ